VPIIFYVVIRFYPTGNAMVLSFQSWNLLGDREWAGLANYRVLFSDPVFWQVFWNTFKYLLIGTPISLATMYSFGLDHGAVGGSLLSPDSRFLRYPVYFFFGMLMAERGLPTRYLGVTLLLSALGMGWWSALYGSENGLAFVPARLLMCLGLIALLPQLSAVRLSFAPLNAVGRDSLFFYLWHPLAMAAVMLAGVGPLPMLALSILLLAIASRLAARNALAQRLVGSAMPSRSASAPMGQAPAPASA